MRWNWIQTCLSAVREAACRRNCPAPKIVPDMTTPWQSLYAKMGLSEQSLEYLRKAMEDGYKDLKNVYRDVEFAQLRKNPRFTELMASNTPVISN